MKVEVGRVPGVLIIEPTVFADARGFCFESWRRDAYREAGIREDFVQDNVSLSGRGVIRGLHLQHPDGQGKLVCVLQGEVLDVTVDVRVGSPWFGQSTEVCVSAGNHRQVYVPPGFAHGFQVVSESALLVYKCTAYYRPDTELSILWSDPDIGVRWPLANPIVSGRDSLGHRLNDVPSHLLPPYPG